MRCFRVTHKDSKASELIYTVVEPPTLGVLSIDSNEINGK